MKAPPEPKQEATTFQEALLQRLRAAVCSESKFEAETQVQSVLRLLRHR